MSEQTKHTPGEWTISEHPNGFKLEVIAPDGIVCTVAGTSNSAKETYANAKLIAACPDMLAALESALGMVNFLGIQGPEEFCEKAERTLSQARAAIAKAKGTP